MLKERLIVYESLGPGERQWILWVRNEDMVCCSRFMLLDQIICGFAHGDVIVHATGFDSDPSQNNEGRRRRGCHFFKKVPEHEQPQCCRYVATSTNRCSASNRLHILKSFLELVQQCLTRNLHHVQLILCHA